MRNGEAAASCWLVSERCACPDDSLECGALLAFAMSGTVRDWPDSNELQSWCPTRSTVRCHTHNASLLHDTMYDVLVRFHCFGSEPRKGE